MPAGLLPIVGIATGIPQRGEPCAHKHDGRGPGGNVSGWRGYGSYPEQCGYGCTGMNPPAGVESPSTVRETATLPAGVPAEIRMFTWYRPA